MKGKHISRKSSKSIRREFQVELSQTMVNEATNTMSIRIGGLTQPQIYQQQALRIAHTVSMEVASKYEWQLQEQLYSKLQDVVQSIFDKLGEEK